MHPGSRPTLGDDSAAKTLPSEYQQTDATRRKVSKNRKMEMLVTSICHRNVDGRSLRTRHFPIGFGGWCIIDRGLDQFSDNSSIEWAN